MLVAAVGAAAVVLREAVAYDRPEQPPAPPRPVDPVRASPVMTPAVARAVDVLEPGSMLAALTGATESDERSAVRRVAALLVLLTLTLATAALVGAGIYRAVAGLD